MTGAARGATRQVSAAGAGISNPEGSRPSPGCRPQDVQRVSGCMRSFPGRREEEGEALPQMNDGQLTHPEPDPAPFKVHLLTRAGRAMRAHTEPVRAFSTKDEAVRFAGRQLGGNYAVYHKDRKIWPISHDAPR